MAQRITDGDLEQLVRVINKTMGFDLEPYGKDEAGKFKQNPKVYVLDHAYGGVALDQNMPDRGRGSHGVRDILGRGTKRELYDKLSAFLRGIEVGQERTSE